MSVSENKEKFISIIQKYFHIVENKKTNGNTPAQKEKAWEKIKAEVIEKIGGQWTNICPKTSWNHMKMQARKYKAATRSELYKTGGGKSLAPAHDPILEKIASLIGKSATGITIPKSRDSDAIPSTPSTSTYSVGDIFAAEAIDEEMVDDPHEVFTTLVQNEEIASWGSGEGAASLKRPISEHLRQIRQNTVSVDVEPSGPASMYNTYMKKKIEKEETKIEFLKLQIKSAQLQIQVSEEKLKRLKKDRL